MKRTIDSTLWKTGNSYVVTIPKKIIKKFNMKVGDDVEIAMDLQS